MLGALLLAATPAALAQSPAAGRTYVIATDVTFAPFEFQNEQGDFVGIDMDLIREIAEDQGVDLCLCYRTGGHEDVAFTGLYKANPAEALRAAMALSMRLTAIQEISRGRP